MYSNITQGSVTVYKLVYKIVIHINKYLDDFLRINSMRFNTDLVNIFCGM